MIYLTNRLKRLALDRDIDFTDHHYQLTLPMHARATASMAVKTNLKITEFVTEPNMITCQQKVSWYRASAHGIILNLNIPTCKKCDPMQPRPHHHPFPLPLEFVKINSLQISVTKTWTTEDITSIIICLWVISFHVYNIFMFGNEIIRK